MNERRPQGTHPLYPLPHRVVRVGGRPPVNLWDAYLAGFVSGVALVIGCLVLIGVTG